MIELGGKKEEEQMVIGNTILGLRKNTLAKTHGSLLRTTEEDQQITLDCDILLAESPL